MKQARGSHGHIPCGFSLVELLVVMAIISVLAAMLLPSLQQALDQARYARWMAFATQRACDPDLVAYYTFEEKSGTVLKNRAGGTGEDGLDPTKLDGKLLKPGAAWAYPDWVSGRWASKGALLFSGESAPCGIDCGNDKAWRIRNAFTVEASFRVTSYGTSGQDWIIAYDNCQSGSNSYGWDLITTAAVSWRGRFRLVPTASVAGNWSTTSMPYNWIHAVMTYDGSTMKMYHNGVLVRTVATIGGPIIYTNSPTQRCKIGVLSWSNTNYFNGVIDEIAVYKRALAEDEIRAYYHTFGVR